MSYVMEFEDSNKVEAKDTVIKYDGFSVVVDPKSLMFVYGMTLNYRFRATRVGRSASATAMHAHPRSNVPHGKDQQGCAGEAEAAAQWSISRDLVQFEFRMRVFVPH